MFCSVVVCSFATMRCLKLELECIVLYCLLFTTDTYYMCVWNNVGSAPLCDLLNLSSYSRYNAKQTRGMARKYFYNSCKCYLPATLSKLKHIL